MARRGVGWWLGGHERWAREMERDHNSTIKNYEERGFEKWMTRWWTKWWKGMLLEDWRRSGGEKVDDEDKERMKMKMRRRKWYDSAF
jgi:hypothetical protein